jgi:hypothetical protein
MRSPERDQTRTDYRHIPPEWIAYRQTAVFDFPIEGQATCFAVQNDSTFIVGTADPPGLYFFDDTGTLLRTIDLPEEPRAIVCGTPNAIFTDKIIIAHPQHIAVHSAEGVWETSWKLPDDKSDVRSLVLTPEYLFAADTGNRSVHRWSLDGNLGLTFGNDFVVYASPIVMTYSPATDFLYVANPGKHRVEVFTQDGIFQPELSFGEPSASLSGFAGCCNPIGLAVLDDGRILTVEKAVSRVKIFKTDGQLDCVVAGYDILEDTWQKPNQRYFAVAVLSDGSIVVFDFECAVMRIFEEHVPGYLFLCITGKMSGRKRFMLWSTVHYPQWQKKRIILNSCNEKEKSVLPKSVKHRRWRNV